MIAYYAHAHGSGHARYASLWHKAFKGELTIFTSARYAFLPACDTVYLPDENLTGREADPDLFPTPTHLHYAPVGNAKITQRNAMILEHCQAQAVRLLIVDVSVEVANLARVSSIPYAYVRLFGNRSDIPHTLAFEGAAFLIAYYPEALEPKDTPQWIRKKTVYLDFFSRFSGKKLSRAEATRRLELPATQQYITLIQGFGGHEDLIRVCRELHGHFPEHRVLGIGPGTQDLQEPNYTGMGKVKEVTAYLCAADFVIGAPGQSLVSEIASLGLRFVAWPQPRPFEEQEQMAGQLYLHGLAAYRRPMHPEQAYQQLPARGDKWEAFHYPEALGDLYHWLSHRQFRPELILRDIRLQPSLRKLYQQCLKFNDYAPM